MDKEKALEIISMIADGYNPYGDENSTQNLPELHPVTIRALCVAIASLLSHTDKSVLIKNYRTWDRIELAKIASGPLQKHLIDQEKKMIFNALAKSDFDISQTANEMNLEPDELEKRIEALGITKDLGLQIFGKVVERDYHHVIKKKGLDYYLSTLEKNAIKTALAKTDDNKTQAADILGATFRSFRYRMDKLSIYQEPENVVLNDEILLDFFKNPDECTLDEFMNMAEKKILEVALEEADFVKNRAADLLGITFRSFRYRMDRFGIE